MVIYEVRLLIIIIDESRSVSRVASGRRHRLSDVVMNFGAVIFVDYLVTALVVGVPFVVVVRGALEVTAGALAVEVIHLFHVNVGVDLSRS